MYESNGVSHRIKLLRIKKNISVRDMAKQIGIGHKTIYNWKNGNQKPNSDKIVLLSEFFDTSCDYILKGIDKN